MTLVYYEVKGNYDGSDALDRDVSKQAQASWTAARTGAGYSVANIGDSIHYPRIWTQGNKSSGGTFYSVKRTFIPFNIPSRFNLTKQDPYNAFVANSTKTLHVYKAELRTRSSTYTVSTGGLIKYYLGKVKLVKGTGSYTGGTPGASDFDVITDLVPYDDESGVTISGTNLDLQDTELNATALNDINKLFGSNQGGQFTICMMNYEHDYLNSDPISAYDVSGVLEKQYYHGCNIYAGDHATLTYGPLLMLYYNTTKGKSSLTANSGKMVIKSGKVIL